MDFMTWLKQWLSSNQVGVRSRRDLAAASPQDASLEDIRLLDDYLRQAANLRVPTRSVGQAAFYRTDKAQDLARALQIPVISPQGSPLEDIIRTQIEVNKEDKYPAVRGLRQFIPPGVSMRMVDEGE